MKKGLLFFGFILLAGSLSGLLARNTPAQDSSALLRYKQWLSEKGLNRFLQVQELSTQKDGQATLYLRFKRPYEPAAVWDSLSSKLQAKKGYSLDKLLFFAMLNALHIPPQKARIAIYNTYQPGKTAKDTVYVNYADSAITSYLAFTPIRAASPGIRKLHAGDFLNGSDTLTFRIYRRNLSEAYRKIRNYLKGYYRLKINRDFNQRFQILQDEDEEVLQVRVFGLQREVLYDKNNPWVAKMANWVFGYDLDWTPVEIIDLTVELNYRTRQEVQLVVRLDGKIGSGIYKNVNWENGNNMEPAFDWYLTRYANNKAQEIKELFR